MGLISGLLAGGNGNGVNNSHGNDNGSAGSVNNDTATTEPTETNDAVSAPEETQSSDTTTGNSSIGANVYYVGREDEADTGRVSLVDGDLTLRENEVIAVDFARRAAIAAQAKAKVEGLLDGLKVEEGDDSAYLKLSSTKIDADGAYAKADATEPRYGAKVSYDV